ncbi:hypothetical protein LPJ73_007185 [Coemansia sp. RSA 2703]|nr:hypothetical protein LPJ73_007185 [Coemansia sp. RSA 2703]
MQIPVYPRERNANGFRRIFVPPTIPESGAASTGRKRKPRQPRQPRKKQALHTGAKDRDGGSGNAGGSNPVPSGSGSSAATTSAAATAASVPATKQPVDVVSSKQQAHQHGASSRTNGQLQAPPKTHPPQSPQSIAATGAEREHGSGSVDMHVPAGNSGALGLKV